MFKLLDKKILERMISSSNLDPASKARLLEVMASFEKEQHLSPENKAKALEILQNVSKQGTNTSTSNEQINKLINKVSTGQTLSAEEIATLKGLGEQLKKQ